MKDRAILLINLGSPEELSQKAVRAYLKEFLSDPFVIDIHPVLRTLLVYGIILPFRSPKTLALYKKIWTQDSPLILYTESLARKLKSSLNSDVYTAMRYGSKEKSISKVIKTIAPQYDHVTILPLYPQYADSSTGTALKEVFQALEGVYPKKIEVISSFFDQPFYISSLSQTLKPYMDQNYHWLFSYHGLPERHLTKLGCPDICSGPCLASKPLCYRSQCYKTTELVAQTLGLSHYTVGFQSRLGRTPWIKPYTDQLLQDLAQQGVKKLGMVCPSFVVDCLETLEEIQIRAREQWKSLGGEDFLFVPCLNDQEHWVYALSQSLRP